MDNKRRNELILLSQRICDSANGMLKEYLEKTYAEAGLETMGDQLDDWLYVAEESCAYMLGNATRSIVAPRPWGRRVARFAPTGSGRFRRRRTAHRVDASFARYAGSGSPGRGNYGF